MKEHQEILLAIMHGSGLDKAQAIENFENLQSKINMGELQTTILYLFFTAALLLQIFFKKELLFFSFQKQSIKGMEIIKIFKERHRHYTIFEIQGYF